MQRRSRTQINTATTQDAATECADVQIAIVMNRVGCSEHKNDGQSSVKRHSIYECYFLKITFRHWCPGMQCIPVTVVGN
jgi:DNA polymerase sigma